MLLAVFVCLCGFIYPAFGAAASNNQLVPETLYSLERNSRNLNQEASDDVAKLLDPEDLPSRKFYQEVLVTTIKKTEYKDDLELFTTEYLTKILHLLRKYHETHEATVKTRNLNKIVNLLLYFAKKSETGNYWYSRIMNEPKEKSEVYIRDLLNEQWLRKIFIMVVQSEFDFDVMNRPSSASVYLENWSEPQDVFTMTKLKKPDVSEEYLPKNTKLLKADRLTHILQVLKRQEHVENDAVRLRVLQKIKKIVALLLFVARGNKHWYKDVSDNPKDNLQLYVQQLLRQKQLYKILYEVENSGDQFAFHNKPDLVKFTLSAEVPYDVLKVVDTSDVYNDTDDVTYNPVTQEDFTAANWVVTQSPDTFNTEEEADKNVPDLTKENALNVHRLVFTLQFLKQQETKEKDVKKLHVLEKIKKIVSLLLLGAENGDDQWYKDVVNNPKDDLQFHVKKLLKQNWLYELLHEVQNSPDLQRLYKKPKLLKLTMHSDFPYDVSNAVKTSDVYNYSDDVPNYDVNVKTDKESNTDSVFKVDNDADDVTNNPVSEEDFTTDYSDVTQGSDTLEDFDVPQNVPDLTKENALNVKRLVFTLQFLKQQETKEKDVKKLRVLEKIKKIVSLLLLGAENGDDKWYKDVVANPKDDLQAHVKRLLKQKWLYDLLHEVQNGNDLQRLYRRPKLLKLTMHSDFPYDVSSAVKTSDVYNYSDGVPNYDLNLNTAKESNTDSVFNDFTNDQTNNPVTEEDLTRYNTDATQGPHTLEDLDVPQNVPDFTKEDALNVKRLVFTLQFLKQQETKEKDVRKLRVLEKIKKIVSLLLLGAENGDDQWYKDVVDNPKDDLQFHVKKLLKQKWVYDLLREVQNSPDLLRLYRKPKLLKLTMHSDFPYDVSNAVKTSDVYNYSDDVPNYDLKPETEYNTESSNVDQGPVTNTKTDFNFDYNQHDSSDSTTYDDSVTIEEQDNNNHVNVEYNTESISPAHSSEVFTEHYPINFKDYELFTVNPLPSQNDNDEEYLKVPDESVSVPVIPLNPNLHFEVSISPNEQTNVNNYSTPAIYDDIIDNNERYTSKPLLLPTAIPTYNIFDVTLEHSDENDVFSTEFATEPTKLEERNNDILRVAITQLRNYIKGEDNTLPSTMKLFNVNNLLVVLNNLSQNPNKNALHSKLTGVILELVAAASTNPDTEDWYKTVIKHPRTPVENNAKSLLLEERLHILIFGLYNNNNELDVIDRPPLNGILKSWKLPALERTESPDFDRPDEPSPEYLLTATNLLETLKALEHKLETLPKDQALLNLERVLTVFLISALKSEDKHNWYQDIIENPKDFSEQSLQKTLTEEQFIKVLSDLYRNNNDFKDLINSEQVTYMRNVTVPTVNTIEYHVVVEHSTENLRYVTDTQPEIEINTNRYVTDSHPDIKVNTPSNKRTDHEVYDVKSLKKIQQILETSPNVRIPLHLKQKLQYILKLLLTVAEKPNSGYDWYTKTLYNPEDDLDKYVQLLLQQNWLKYFLVELHDSSFDVKSLRNLVLVQRLQAWRFPKYVLKIVPATSRIIGIQIVEAREGDEKPESPPVTSLQKDIQFIVNTIKTDVDVKVADASLRLKLLLRLYTKKALRKIAIYLKRKGYSNSTILDLVRKLNDKLKSHRLKWPTSNHGFYEHAEDIITPILTVSTLHVAPVG